MRHLFSVGLVLAFLVACSEPAKPTARKARTVPQDWVSVTAEKKISETEDVRLMRLASPIAPQMHELDSTCILYRNHEFKTAQLVCPGGAPDLSYYDPS